jgi:hypothetical protein
LKLKKQPLLFLIIRVINDKRLLSSRTNKFNDGFITNNYLFAKLFINFPKPSANDLSFFSAQSTHRSKSAPVGLTTFGRITFFSWLIVYILYVFLIFFAKNLL